ncbi:MAG: phosphatase PAP2 family protein [Cryobacterium sp.]
MRTSRNTLTVAQPLRYLGAAVLTLLLFGALYVFFVLSSAGQLVDQLSYDGAENGWRSVTPFTRRLLDSVPAVSVVVGLALTVVISLVRRNGVTLLVALGAAFAALLSSQLLKHALLTRPDLGVDGYASNSFPSGHTTVAAAAVLVVFLVASPRTRPVVAAAGTGFAVVAGVATLANQWHRPSDVVAALLLVSFWGCVAGAVLSLRRASGPRVRPGRGRAATRWLLVFVVLPAGAVAGVALLVSVLRASADSPAMLVAYVGGVAGIVAMGTMLALAGTRLFARLP